jgi:hypothetical protein
MRKQEYIAPINEPLADTLLLHRRTTRTLNNYSELYKEHFTTKLKNLQLLKNS